MSKNNVKWTRYFLILIVLSLVYFPVFLRLASSPIAVWDESLFGLRALYLADTGSYLSNFNLLDGLQDHRNTKLPFTTFFQVIAIKLFGLSELSIRLPISIIFLSTCAFFTFGCNTVFKKYSIGILFTLALVSSANFVDVHMLRSGDQDVPFACYIVIAIVSLYTYLEQRRLSSLVVFTLAMIAALLTKNILAFAIGPGILFFLFFNKRFVHCIKDASLWISVGLILATYCGTIFYLDYKYPGFVDRMFGYELTGRFQNVIENHKGDRFFYLSSFFKPYIWWLIILLAFLFDKNMKKTTYDLILLLLCCFATYTCVISISETKIYWYAAPMYTMAALAFALLSYHVYENYIKNCDLVLRYSILTMFVAVFSICYIYVIEHRTTRPDFISKGSKCGLFLDYLESTGGIDENLILLDTGFGTSSYFYKEMYNRNHNYNLTLTRNADYQVGDKVMTCFNNGINKINKAYNADVIEELEGCRLVLIKSKK